MKKTNAFHLVPGQTVTFAGGRTGTIEKIYKVRVGGLARLELHFTDGTMRVATGFTNVTVAP